MTNDNTINARIRELIQFLDITDNAFAKKIGVTQSVIASMFQRGTEPSAKVITSILCTYEEISAEWLLRGKGDMLFQKEETEPGLSLIHIFVSSSLAKAVTISFSPFSLVKVAIAFTSVSYTHLDVYKRQIVSLPKK